MSVFIVFFIVIGAVVLSNEFCFYYKLSAHKTEIIILLTLLATVLLSSSLVLM